MLFAIAKLTNEGKTEQPLCLSFSKKMWEEHPEERVLKRTTIYVTMEMVSENKITGTTIVIDSDSVSLLYVITEHQ